MESAKIKIAAVENFTPPQKKSCKGLDPKEKVLQRQLMHAEKVPPTSNKLFSNGLSAKRINNFDIWQGRRSFSFKTSPYHDFCISSYTQPILWSSIWHRNFRRDLLLYTFITSLLLHVEKIHYLLFHRLNHNCVLLLRLSAYFATYLISICGILVSYISYLRLFNSYYSVTTVYSVLIVSMSQCWVYPLPSTLCDSMYGRRFLQLL